MYLLKWNNLDVFNHSILVIKKQNKFGKQLSKF